MISMKCIPVIAEAMVLESHVKLGTATNVLYVVCHCIVSFQYKEIETNESNSFGSAFCLYKNVY